MLYLNRAVLMVIAMHGNTTASTSERRLSDVGRKDLSPGASIPPSASQTPWLLSSPVLPRTGPLTSGDAPEGPVTILRSAAQQPAADGQEHDESEDRRLEAVREPCHPVSSAAPSKA
jgi:hypothetical protein